MEGIESIRRKGIEGFSWVRKRSKQSTFDCLCVFPTTEREFLISVGS